MLDEVAHVTLAVADTTASGSLYGEGLGLVEVPGDTTPAGGQIRQFAVGPSILALRGVPPAQVPRQELPGQPPVVDHFALHVDDMQATYATLKGRHVPHLGEPSATAIGHRNMQRALLALEDPEGLYVQFSETIDPRPHVERRKAAKRRMAAVTPGPFGGFDHISTYCRDFAAARDFFATQLGLEEFFHSTSREAGETVMAGFAQAAFAVGGTDIELATAPVDKALRLGVIQQLSFWTCDLDAVLQRLQDHAAPVDSDWVLSGGVRRRCLTVHSPDGLEIGIVEH
jgi:catechol 2,3-dioxygenase-like lactoylglutathione lyase family enzyme